MGISMSLSKENLKQRLELLDKAIAEQRHQLDSVAANLNSLIGGKQEVSFLLSELDREEKESAAVQDDCVQENA